VEMKPEQFVMFLLVHRFSPIVYAPGMFGHDASVDSHTTNRNKDMGYQRSPPTTGRYSQHGRASKPAASVQDELYDVAATHVLCFSFPGSQNRFSFQAATPLIDCCYSRFNIKFFCGRKCS